VADGLGRPIDEYPQKRDYHSHREITPQRPWPSSRTPRFVRRMMASVRGSAFQGELYPSSYSISIVNQILLTQAAPAGAAGAHICLGGKCNEPK